MRYFDKDSDNCINIDDFLYSIRGKPNEERQDVIDLVYYKFDKMKTGQAETTELRKVFNCVKHPRYLMGDYSEDQIFKLYLKNFNNDSNISYVTKKVYNNNNNRNGMIIMQVYLVLLMMIYIS